MNECPKCRERDAKAASCCEANLKELQKKYHKLLLVFAVLSGVLGKELMDRTVSLFETVSPVIDVVSEAPKPQPATSFYASTADTSLLFADVPPILTNLNFTTYPENDIFFEDEYDYVCIPEVGQLALLGSLPFLMNKRRR